MPIYEYHCTDCEKDFELFLRSMSAKEEVNCPNCGSPKIRKSISLFGGMSGGSASVATGASASCAPSG